MFITSFLSSDASIELTLFPPFQPLRMWARLIAIFFCRFSQRYTFTTKAATMSQGTQRGMQYFVSQLVSKWTTISKSFRHCTWIIRYQGYLINSFLCYATVVCDCYPLGYGDKRHLLCSQKGKEKSG